MTAKNIAIVGAGGMAKEMIGYLEDDARYVVKLVISDTPINNAGYQYPIITPEQYRQGETRGCHIDELFLCVAEPPIKHLLVDRLGPDAAFGTYVHPLANVSPYATVGRGCVLTPYAMAVGDSKVGDFCFFNTHAVIGHDSVLGDFSSLQPHAEICGNCKVGHDVQLGIGCYVIPWHNIADNVTVGAGAVVIRSIEEPGVYVPAAGAGLRRLAA